MVFLSPILNLDLVESHLPIRLCLVVISLVIVVASIISFSRLLSPFVQTINVPLPQQARPGWTGNTLSDPSIHGSDSSVIVCYCPATGQLIGTQKAATKTDVDTAIEKAKAAQSKWRTTTHKQRVLVLRTILKFVLENQGKHFICRH
jgi:hypothetical protein